jgi:hypothetical protein
VTFVRVTGTLEGESVWATWEDGAVYGDERLLAAVREHVDTGAPIAIADTGPLIEAGIDDPWSFTVTVSALVDEPIVSGDDLPSTASPRQWSQGSSRGRVWRLRNTL